MLGQRIPASSHDSVVAAQQGVFSCCCSTRRLQLLLLNKASSVVAAQQGVFSCCCSKRRLHLLLSTASSVVAAQHGALSCCCSIRRLSQLLLLTMASSVVAAQNVVFSRCCSTWRLHLMLLNTASSFDVAQHGVFIWCCSTRRLQSLLLNQWIPGFPAVGLAAQPTSLVVAAPWIPATSVFAAQVSEAVLASLYKFGHAVSPSQGWKTDQRFVMVNCSLVYVRIIWVTVLCIIMASSALERKKSVRCQTEVSGFLFVSFLFVCLCF